MNKIKIIEVTPQNVLEETLFCIKDIKKPEFHAKRKWYEKRYEEGLRMKILKDETDKMIGFIEYVAASKAWRPVDKSNFMFIHCMVVYSKSDRNKGFGSMLIEVSEKEAKAKNMDGLCVMTSKGSWLADKRIFEGNGFIQLDQKDRFELLVKKWNLNAPNPKLLNWTKQQQKYKGWNLVYADQCPWHEKSVLAIKEVAKNYDININITKLETVEEAKNAPSGYGVFNLLHNGKLLEDHYISATRFENILKKELKK
jgi:N-acetylglutamate synthase-like GNAT family acetyltransferase